MSIETDIVAQISATFSGRVRADTAPANTTRPFCIYQGVGGAPVSSFCGDATQQNSVVQFWVWADTRNAANTQMRALATILSAAPLRGVSQGGLTAEYNEVTDTYGAMQRFSFWS